ncbi:MAG: hypothetical protein JWQ14_520 [Adhaeribacter sp.]|nr:hypothetical protein [Adhaeribacter sp.]
MIILPRRCLLLIGFLVATFNFQVQAQVITAGPDSVVVRPPEAKAPIYQISKWSEPGKAALMSAIVPGLGQAYNKSYWKIPLIYAGGAALGYYLHYNHQQYLRFRKAYELRTDGLDSTVDRYATIYKQPETLSKGRDTYRRWRDYTFLYSALFYGIYVSEAYVYAHLKDFDISDELSMRVQPDLLPSPNNKVVPALTLSFNLKK